MTEPPAAAERPAASRGNGLRRGPVLGLIALVVVLGAFAFWNRPRPARHAKADAAPVRTGDVVRRNMAVIERSTGTVLAATSVQVLPQVSGQLLKQAFREGQFVKAGEVLFQIDPAPYQAAVAQAQGVYAKDAALLENAQRDQGRFERLYAQDSTSQQLRDTAIANSKVLAATVASDKAALEAARLNLSYTTIRSPVAGKTGPVLIQPGNIVTAPSSGPLVSVAQVQPVKVSFTLPQSDLPRIQARQRVGVLTVRLEIEGPGGRSYAAPVDFVSNAVSALSGTIELRATFQNADLALVPGQLVRAVVTLDDLDKVIVVPRNAVNDSPSGPFVYLVDRGSAVLRPVTVLFDDGQDIAVQGHLEVGQKVITEGQLRVDAGVPVHVLGPSTPPPRLASDKIHPAR